MAGKRKVQFEFSEVMLDVLDKLQQKTGATSHAEVARQAIGIYDWLANSCLNSEIIHTTPGRETKTVVFAGLMLNDGGN